MKAINMQPLWDRNGRTNSKAMTYPNAVVAHPSKRRIRATKPTSGRSVRIKTVKGD